MVINKSIRCFAFTKLAINYVWNPPIIMIATTITTIIVTFWVVCYVIAEAITYQHGKLTRNRYVQFAMFCFWKSHTWTLVQPIETLHYWTQKHAKKVTFQILNRPRPQVNKQYFIWKLVSLAKIWDPIDIAEVKIWASSGCPSGQVQEKKKCFTLSKIFNFWVTKT